MESALKWFIFTCAFVLKIVLSLGCDYFQKMVPGETYEIFSPNYSKRYSTTVNCRWVAVAPNGYNIDLDCTDVDLPKSLKCSADRLELSEKGRLDLKDGRRICGTGDFLHRTPNNRLVMSLTTPRRSKGGKLYCKTRAVKSNCACGRRERTRIVGGIKTKTNEFPWMAGLVDTSTNEKVYCGATLISDRYFLTAGHCVENRKIRNLVLLVGDDNTTASNDTPYAALYRIEQVIVHPLYKENGIEHDIAIIKTSESVEFNDGVSPACLPFRFDRETFEGSIVTALGWGTTEFSGPKTDKLMKVDLEVIDDETCLEQGMDITIGHMCTFTKGKDSCQFDSGGPLLYLDQEMNRYHLVGIISFGAACASNYPSVNMRVTSYLDWVVENTPEVDYCDK